MLKRYLKRLAVLSALVIAILFVVSRPAKADEWTTGNKLLFSGFVGLQIVDGLQTYQITKHPERWKEMNPLYGEHPSVQRIVLVKGITTGLAYHLLDNYADSKGRNAALWFMNAMYIGVVAHNYSLGIRVKF